MKKIFVSAAAIAVLAMSAGSASAQSTRTWVSGVGDDANPCSRTAPCKTFAGAISKTAPGGEISVLDPGGFGALTITKSISIVSDGSEASILVAGTAGITINAGVNDVVSIYGLKFEGTGTGIAGINVIQAGKVYISHVYIRDFLASGQGYGVAVQSASAATRVYLNNVEIVNNNTGLYVHGGAGYNAVFVDTCVLESNATNSAYIDTANSGVTLTNSKLAGSSVFLANGGALTSTGNNFVAGTVGPNGSAPFK